MNESLYRFTKKVIIKSFLVLFYPIIVPVVLIIYYPLLAGINFFMSDGPANFKQEMQSSHEILRDIMLLRVG